MLAQRLTGLHPVHCFASLAHVNRRGCAAAPPPGRRRWLLAGGFEKCEPLLSPQGRLSAPSCPVGLAHDRTDSLVPWEHSQRIFDELSAATPGLGHRLVVTSLLQHVRPTKVLQLKEGIEMMRLVAMLWDWRQLIGACR